MPLKRTVIEAAADGSGLRITREKLPNYSGNADDRRKARRAGEELHFSPYQVRTVASIDGGPQSLPEDVRQWLYNSHWPLEIVPLNSEDAINQAAANHQAAKDGRLYAAAIVAVNQAWQDCFVVEKAKTRKVVFLDEGYGPLRHWSEFHGRIDE